MATQTFEIYSIPQADAPPEVHMLRLASGHIAAQAIYAFAALGIPDLLQAGYATIPELANQSQSNATALHRLLRFLATIDVVAEREDCSYALTRLGRTLCSQPSSAVRDNILMIGMPCYWSAIGGLLRNVKTGDTAFDHVHKTTFFEYLGTHPHEAHAFSAAMHSASQLSSASILAAYDFAPFRRIVDVGGGKGAFLQAVLRKHRDAHGILFDSQEIIDEARPDALLADRITMIAGSFFASVPPGADLYVLRRILHDWDDGKAIDILRRCRAAMLQTSKLLVIELAAPEPGQPRNDWAGLDLLMMVLLGGRERTREDLEALLRAADLEISRVVTTNSSYWIVESIPSSRQSVSLTFATA